MTSAYPFLPGLMPFWYVTVFVLGTCFGSFLNVVIYRVPAGLSLLTPPSHCPVCKYEIPWYRNIPLISWLLLRGKCGNCAARIPARYFLVELLTGILFLPVFSKVIFYHEPLPVLAVYFGLTMLAITTVFIDLECRIIPDKTTGPAMVLGLVAAAAFPATWHCGSHWLALAQSLLCLIVSGGLLSLFAIIGAKLFRREALGWGDVKYIAAIGAGLGLKGAYFTVLAGALAGSVAGIIIMIWKKKDFKSSIPFGPFLALGTYLWILFDRKIIGFYEAVVKHFQL
ncbi:MAG: prepilin peptidase [Victivallaceae bacterium]|nr:prepilin peptidase [Victivallaceae bacterium]